MSWNGMFFFEEQTSDCSFQISPQGFFQGIFLSAYDRDNTEMIYSRLKDTNIPQDHGGPHTQTTKAGQTAQTGLEAWDLLGMG